MEFYNTKCIVRVVISEAQKSKNWNYLPVKSLNTRIDFIINYKMWKINRTQAIYQNIIYPECYAFNEIKNVLNDNEYMDKETKQIMEYPKVTLYLADGTNTEIHFTTYNFAEQYARALINKSRSFIQLDKIGN